MLFILYIIGIVTSVNGLSATDCFKQTTHHEVCNYMTKYNKEYAHHGELQLRHAILRQRSLQKHSDTWRSEWNDATDRKHYPNHALRLKLHRETHLLGSPVRPTYKLTSTKHIDYRPQMSLAKNQGQCGDCFAFSAIGTLEWWYTKLSKKKIQLSEQSAMDCTSKDGPNFGCDGGLMEYVFNFAARHPIATESNNPYEATEGVCKKKYNTIINVRDYGVLMKEDDKHAEDYIPWILENYGPVGIGIDVSNEKLFSYKDGIFSANDCGTDIDHAVLIVGMGTYPKPYWIVKNSWGDKWGQQGYFYLEKGKNACGVAEYITYVKDAHLVNQQEFT